MQTILFSRIIVHAWNRDMASSFTSIRNQNATCIRHYLLYNRSLTARCGPTSVTVHALLVSRARIATFTEQPLNGNEVTKSAYLSYCFPHNLLVAMSESQKYASFLLQRPYLNVAATYLHQIEYRDFIKAWVHLHLLICLHILSFFFVILR